MAAQSSESVQDSTGGVVFVGEAQGACECVLEGAGAGDSVDRNEVQGEVTDVSVTEGGSGDPVEDMDVDAFSDISDFACQGRDDASVCVFSPGG